MRTGMLQRLLVNRWLGWLVLLPIVLMIVATAYQLERVQSDPNASTLMVKSNDLASKRTLNDFDEFYLIGQLYHDESVLKAYDVNYLLSQQKRYTGSISFLPWTYPPQFTALMSLLPLLSIPYSFLMFTGGSLLFYLFAVRRGDWQYSGAAMLAVFPALLLNARLGQNGFLTAGLIGLILFGFRTSSRAGGIPLGLLAMKPHLGAGLALLALLERRWGMIFTAVMVVVITCCLATIVLGLEAWPAWFAGVRQSSGFLNEGLYALYRLSSVYAMLRSFGASAGTAFVLHMMVALAAIALLIFVYLRKWPRNRVLALTALVNLLVSPYNHDYDYVCITFGLMLILPEFIALSRSAELIAFYVLAWIGTGAGLAQHLRAAVLYGTIDHPLGSSLNWSIEALAIVAAASLIAFVLFRAAGREDIKAGGDNPSSRHDVRAH